MKINRSIILITTAAVLLCGCNNDKSHTSVTEDSQQSAIENYSVSDESTVKTDPQPQTSEAVEEFPFYGMEIPTESLTVGNLPANVKVWGSNAFFCCYENAEKFYPALILIQKPKRLFWIRVLLILAFLKIKSLSMGMTWRGISLQQCCF